MVWHCVDVKVLHAGGPPYRSARARDQQSGAVAEREHTIQREYERHATALDARFGRADGAVASRLAALGPIRGLVFGAYGEVSEDVAILISEAADCLARHFWRADGARTEAEARGFWMQRLRRRVSCLVAISYARYLLHRLPFIGVPLSALGRTPPRRGVHATAPRASPATDFYAHQAVLTGVGLAFHWPLRELDQP